MGSKVVTMIYKKKHVKVTTIIFGALFLGACIWLVVGLVEFVPPSALTRNSMISIRNRIRNYAIVNNRIPGSYDDLPKLDGASNRITDGWGHLIVMTITEKDILLQSYGEDGQLDIVDGDDIVGLITIEIADGQITIGNVEFEERQ